MTAGELLKLKWIGRERPSHVYLSECASLSLRGVHTRLLDMHAAMRQEAVPFAPASIERHHVHEGSSLHDASGMS